MFRCFWPARVQDEDEGPFTCPITHELMKDPVVTRAGTTYERKAIEEHICYQRRRRGYASDPITACNIDLDLYPNDLVKRLIRTKQLKDGSVFGEKLDKLEAEIAKLQATVREQEDVSKQFGETIARLSSAGGVNAELYKENKDLKVKLSSAAELQKENEDLKVELNVHKAESRKVNADLQQAREDYKNLEEVIQALLADNSALSAENRILKTKNEDLLAKSNMVFEVALVSKWLGE
jgi:myosin heavy subunit